MSDLERARNFLAEQDYEFIWRSPDGYEEVWRKGNLNVSLDEVSQNASVTVPVSDLPSLLSGLTLEDVERAIEETHTEVGSWENAQCRVGAFIALGNLMKRLRQRVNGDTCNREEGLERGNRA